MAKTYSKKEVERLIEERFKVTVRLIRAIREPNHHQENGAMMFYEQLKKGLK